MRVRQPAGSQALRKSRLPPHEAWRDVSYGASSCMGHFWAGECIGPPALKKRVPQDDKWVSLAILEMLASLIREFRLTGIP